VSDGLQALIWLAVLAGGWVLVVALHRRGLPATLGRDLLHLGAGSWALGFPFWQGRAAPLALAVSGAALIALVPLVARRARALRRLQDAVASGDERWTGLSLYALSAAALTWPGLGSARFAATAALWALALGDGVGGAIGGRFGRHRFAVPGGKRKSIEGSLAVAAFAAVGAWLAALSTAAPASVLAIAGAGVVAALVEAISPRGTDNVLVPAAVFAWLAL